MHYLAHDREPDKPFCWVISVEPPHPPFEAPPELEQQWLERDITLSVSTEDLFPTILGLAGIEPRNPPPGMRSGLPYAR